MKRFVLISILLLAPAGAAHADSTAVWDGRVRAGGIIIDETGDRSVMQETFNLYEGFALSSLYLRGRMDARTHLLLDLTDINLGDRRGKFDFRRTGMLNLRSTYAENRFVFDPAGNVDAQRRNSYTTLTVTPQRWLWLSGDYNLQTRSGDRLPVRPGPTGWLGSQYDSKLHRWRLEAQARARNGIGGTVAYDAVHQNDALDARRERDGYVASAVVHVPRFYFQRLTHVVRGAFGRSEVSASGPGYDLLSAQYTGIVDATDWSRLKYRFYASQVDDEATRMRTDNYIHELDATLRWRMAIAMLGYGWEARDDDTAVTTSQTLRGSLSLRMPDNRVSGRIAYAARDTEDEEDATLLRDTEFDRFEARVDARPVPALSVGARAANRTRRMPDIGSRAEGWTATGYATWRYQPAANARNISGELGADYTYSDDDYDNTTGSDHVVMHAATGRAGIGVGSRTNLSAAVTYLDAGADLDIQKSILSFGAEYRFGNGISADAQYNVYNYDDYLVFSRYYTANVVWLNVGYEFSRGSNQ
jgi:hypothetical protein